VEIIMKYIREFFTKDKFGYFCVWVIAVLTVFYFLYAKSLKLLNDLEMVGVLDFSLVPFLNQFFALFGGGAALILILGSGLYKMYRDRVIEEFKQKLDLEKQILVKNQEKTHIEFKQEVETRWRLKESVVAAEIETCRQLHDKFMGVYLKFVEVLRRTKLLSSINEGLDEKLLDEITSLLFQVYSFEEFYSGTELDQLEKGLREIRRLLSRINEVETGNKLQQSLHKKSRLTIKTLQKIKSNFEHSQKIERDLE